MTKSPHVLMISNGAELFAKEQGLVMVEPAYFKTDFRWQQLQNALKDEKITLIIMVNQHLFTPQRTTTINMELLSSRVGQRW